MLAIGLVGTGITNVVLYFLCVGTRTKWCVHTEPWWQWSMSCWWSDDKMDHRV